jgi:hypothetical protein
LDYEVTVQPAYIEVLRGFMVHTRVTVYKNGIPRHFESCSFRKIDVNSIYSALETADTVSTGRAFGKMGIGIESDFETSDGLNLSPEQEEKKEVEQQVKEVVSTPKRGRKKTVTSSTGKEITVDLDTGISHGQAVEAVMATVAGDMEVAKEISQQAQEVIDNSIFIPPLPEGGKRSLKDADVKALGVSLSALGAGEDEYKHYIEDTGWELPKGVDTENLRYEFLRYATVEQIQSFINQLKGEN